MSCTKYIVYENHIGLEIASLFPPFINHADMANLLRVDSDKILGAGEMSLCASGHKTSISCFGKSISLKKDSRGKQDAKAVSKLLFPEAYDREENVLLV